MIRQQKQCSRRELRAEGALGVRDSNELFGTTAQVLCEKPLELALGIEPTQARQMDPTKNYYNKVNYMIGYENTVFAKIISKTRTIMYEYKES